MCDSCVPTASAPLRLSTTGCERGFVALLIDSDDLGSVIRVEVKIDALTEALRIRNNDYLTAWDDWIIPSTNDPAVKRSFTAADPGKE